MIAVERCNRKLNSLQRLAQIAGRRLTRALGVKSMRLILGIFLSIFASYAALTDGGNKVIHVLVALCDNEHQGIVKVSKDLGNGDNPKSNLYWGCSGGVKSQFIKSPKWKLLKSVQNPRSTVLERVVFQHESGKVFIVADGYRGRYIKGMLEDYFALLAGHTIDRESEAIPALKREIHAGSCASLIVYVGHNGLMDIEFKSFPKGRSNKEAIALCCESEQYFKNILSQYGAKPILLTTQLMYPGAMVLEGAFEGWIKGESLDQIRARAGEAYARNQKISVKSGMGIFSKL